MEKQPTHWRDLEPEPSIVEALAHAGPRPEDGNQDAKRHWSEQFANGCAVAIANELRRLKFDELRNKKILPESLASGTEPLTPLGTKQKKRIDVTVTDPILGLEIGFSLKGHNFRDGPKYYDKNLTGRLYELGDEVRLVHEHLPHAFMIGVAFLPLDSVADKQKGPSSFANAVTKLRARSGRVDPALLGQAVRCDAGFVALYTTGVDAGSWPAGLVRFMPVENNPPRLGRPKVTDTLSFHDFLRESLQRATEEARVDWSDPEPD